MGKVAAASAEEIALRPDLVKELLKTVSDKVYEHDVEHVIVVGITPTNQLRLYHSYGKDLPMNELATQLTTIATLARKQGRKKP